MSNLLEIKNLRVHYHTFEGIVKAVNGLDLKLKPRQTLGLVGETGAGKTTTALSIMQLISDPPGKIIEGSIVFNGKNLNKLPEKEMKKIRGNQMSMIFQDPMTSLNPVISVGLQIAEVIEAHQNLSRNEAMKKAAEMLERVQIPGQRANEYPHEFSGGMRQRVGIAMALACNPSLIIADEPTTALDVTIQAQVLDLMNNLKKEFSTAMLMITHDLGVVGEVCDRVAVMYAGEIVEEGSLEDIFTEPLHPYTSGLFKCIPDIEAKESEIHPIKGLMPDPINLPRGCYFSPRCDQVMDICKNKKPQPININDHTVRCHLYNKKGVV